MDATLYHNSYNIIIESQYRYFLLPFWKELSNILIKMAKITVRVVLGKKCSVNIVYFGVHK